MVFKASAEVLACVSASIFHFAVGGIIGFSAILIPQLERSDSSINVTKEDVSWIASIVPLVALVGSILGGCLVDRIGRVKTIKVAAVPFIIGWLCIATANNLVLLLLGRLLTGASMALSFNTATVYVTEVAKPKNRGVLTCTQTSLVSLGMICMSAKGAFFHWRTISWISISFCILPLLLISLWSPESPAWLVSRGKSEQALKSLLILYQKENIAEQQLEKLIKELNKKQRQEYQSSSAFWTLIQGLTKPTGYKPALLLIVIFILQQFSGITVTIYYSVSFFQSVGTSVDPFLSSVGVGVVRLITTVVTSVLLRHFGRRPLFIYSSIGMAISIFIAGYLTKEIQQENIEKNSLPILFILMYVSLGSIGFNTIPWIISAELFPIEIRGMAQSLIMGIAFFNVFSIVKIYPFMDEALGGSFRVQWMFSIVSLIGALFVFVFLPETHKKELIEIEEYFKNNSVYPLRHKRQTRELAEEAALEMIKQ